MTRRRWIAEYWDEATATLTGAQAEHMSRVLRTQPGVEVDVVAGGRVYRATVAAVTPQEVRFNLVAELDAEPALPVTLAMSIFKFDRADDCAAHGKTSGAGGAEARGALAEDCA